MKILLARLRAVLGVELVEKLHTGVLCIHKPNGVLFEVTVPYEVLEWFVDAKDVSGTIWSEWADHYPTHGETRQQLVTEMEVDVERVVTILANSEIRVSPDRGTSEKIIELKVDGCWKSASLVWMTAGPENHSVQT